MIDVIAVFVDYEIKIIVTIPALKGMKTKVNMVLIINMEQRVITVSKDISTQTCPNTFLSDSVFPSILNINDLTQIWYSHI